MRFSAHIVLACILAQLLIGGAMADDQLVGPVEPLVTIDEFEPNSQSSWKTGASNNITHQLLTGVVTPGVADSLAQLQFTRKQGGNAWFTMKRSLPAGSIDAKADGIRLLIGSPGGGKWWLQVRLHVGAETYSHIIEPIYPDRMIVEHTIPFAEFASGAQKMDPAKAIAADAISIVIGPREATLYLDRISTYRQEKYNSWLDLTTSQPNHSIFQPGENVTLTFKPGGNLPAGAKSFRYEIIDFFEKPLASGKIALADSAGHVVNLDAVAPGYYEVRAYWLDAADKDIENRSCIRAEGSLPPGLMTFCVMSRTAEQNIQRFKELGTNAFFGLHGDFMGIADLMGLSWRMGYSRWQYLEPNKPDRSGDGRPEWAQKALKEPPQPDYRLHFSPSSANLAPPAWARNPENVAPPFADWDDYLKHVRDLVAVEMHRYPHMKPRIYGVAWEINLNMPPHNFKPPYTPADVAELHRRVSETIRSVDPDGIVAGPCPSDMEAKWFQSMFEAGVLQHIDAIETHGYASIAIPEKAGYPETLAAMRRLMRQYNDGKELPIYITEAAFRGKLGSQIIHRTQAQLMTRQAIIFKGEGVKVFLPFYGIDYDRDGWWGFCFNREVDAKNPWITKRIAPKPTVNAMATCAQVLEGAAPVRRVHNLGKDIWAYLFDRNGTAILAIWTPGEAQELLLPVGAGKVESINIMGHLSQLQPADGKLPITVSQSPQYLIGISPDALPGEAL